MTGTRDWDAATYARIATPVVALGHEVLGRLELRGDETVLDAGCGTGAVTEALLERLPSGRVIAVDGSASMCALARERLGDRAAVLHQDLLDLDLGGVPTDAILSTATFHWIADHAALFTRLADVLRPGGRLEAQCGGAGNIASVLAAVDAAATELGVDPGPSPWRFAGPRETTALLEAAGFSDVRCSLETRTLDLADPQEWLRTLILGTHLEHLPADRREPFVAAVARHLPGQRITDYVRLNISAIRSPARVGTA